MTKNGTTYYLAYDQVGTLKVVVDTYGNVVKKIEYDTFGNVISDSDPTFEVPFGFAGGLHDKDTGLVRFGYRDYDPETGRWTAKDPIGFAGGDTDLYGYCLNDPVNWADPWGLKLSKSECKELKKFIKGQERILEEYKKIVAADGNNFQKLRELYKKSRTIADAAGYRSDYYDNSPPQVKEIVDIHESYHWWNLPYNLSAILYTVSPDSLGKFIAAEEVRAHTISNRLLNELYKSDCEIECGD